MNKARWLAFWLKLYWSLIGVFYLLRLLYFLGSQFWWQQRNRVDRGDEINNEKGMQKYFWQKITGSFCCNHSNIVLKLKARAQYKLKCST